MNEESPKFLWRVFIFGSHGDPKHIFQLKNWSLGGNGSYSVKTSKSHGIDIKTRYSMCRMGSLMILT